MAGRLWCYEKYRWHLWTVQILDPVPERHLSLKKLLTQVHYPLNLLWKGNQCIWILLGISYRNLVGPICKYHYRSIRSTIIIIIIIYLKYWSANLVKSNVLKISRKSENYVTLVLFAWENFKLNLLKINKWKHSAEYRQTHRLYWFSNQALVSVLTVWCISVYHFYFV